ncbi:MAG: hypothetical protein A2527_14270 [Candidatus Lambdaproteobacteria bacterium RIFOXYD2_FULL_50_16]|uniref:Uncharacterized protein n=1 Tax=Candidatus Lambdaproteobacteria bacterium RIFOXYD2_FULL_50_16 TaxID=1817772 RepID=A0A1F6G4P8_9PROT|nr:MAG: hypothetical protein A2527_14270 [Candidatus Lambdaproteobacteria bacterium RIFOXYD2_FULL_50_16]
MNANNRPSALEIVRALGLVPGPIDYPPPGSLVVLEGEVWVFSWATLDLLGQLVFEVERLADQVDPPLPKQVKHFSQDQFNSFTVIGWIDFSKL